VARSVDAQTIEGFIVGDLLHDAGRKALTMDAPLISSGVIDSLGMLRLIAFLEEEGGLAIGDGDVNPENFETMRKILEFIERKESR
jgi:acyl carrier protein